MADTVTSDSQGREREHEDVAPEVGVNEHWAHLMALLGAKENRILEAYLALGVESARQSQEATNRSRTAYDKHLSDAQQFDNARQVMANQALGHSVETANMVAKQAVRHSDLAIDRQWNTDVVSAIEKAMADRAASAVPQEDMIQALSTILGIRELSRKDDTSG